jgi:hypothetical protein
MAKPRVLSTHLSHTAGTTLHRYTMNFEYDGKSAHLEFSVEAPQSHQGSVDDLVAPEFQRVLAALRELE